MCKLPGDCTLHQLTKCHLYKNSQTTTNPNIITTALNWKLMQKLSLPAYGPCHVGKCQRLEKEYKLFTTNGGYLL